MRDILTIAASLVILVLSVALVGPWFVDWTAHRGWVESELSRISGARVSIGGAVDLKLLPVPRIELQQVHVASQRGEGPALDAAEVKLELAVAPLLRGELRFTDAEVVRPRLTILRQPDGTIVLPRMPNIAPSGVQVEKITLHDGALAFRSPDGADPVALAGLDFTGEAASLVGPFKGGGVLRAPGGEPIRYRFSTGSIEGDRIRLKAIVDESAAAPRSELEGSLAFLAQATGYRPVFEGAGAFSATDDVAGARVAWRLAGPLKADPAGATLEAGEFRAGDDERAVAATGSVQMSFAPAPKLAADFTARQLDLDKLFAAGQDATPPGRRVAALVAGALADPALARRLPFPVTLALASPAVTLAGETLTEFRAEIGLAANAPPQVKLAMQGPARSSLAMDGAVETGAAAAFRGRLDLSVRDLARFSDWLELSLPGQAKQLQDLPFRAIDLAGDMEISAAGALGRRMTLRLDRSELAGTMAYTRAAGREPARLFADLTSDALDLDGLPELAGPARLAADMDLSLALEARAVRLERFGAGFVDAGRIGLKFAKDADGVRLERFSIENVGGANVSASARIGAGETQVDARLDAARLGDLAALLQRIAPGAWANALAQRATALSPARFTLSARGRGANALDDVRVEGTARGTRIEGRAKGSLDAIEATASAESADASMLLRQAGLDTLPLSSTGPARVQMRAAGSLANGFSTNVSAMAARSEAAFDGRVSLSDGTWTGETRLRSPDLAPVLRMLAVVLPDAAAALPVDGSAQVSRSADAIVLDKLSGVVSGAFVNGALRGALDGGQRRWTGDLALDRLSAGALASLALGPMPASARNAVWPDQRFAPGLADPPRVDAKMRVGEFDLADGSVARDASFDLRLGPGLVSIENARMKLGAGSLAGQAALRRDGASASIAAKIEANDVSLPVGPVTGLVSGRLEATATGPSYAALAAGLAGGGQASVGPLVVAGADPAAITRLIDLADRNVINIDENEMRSRLLREFESRPLVIDRRTFDVSAAAGVLRLAPKEETSPSVEFSYDLKTLASVARVSLTAPSPKDWSGPPPAATLVWQRDRAGAQQRSVDAGPLVNAISSRAIAREAARVEALEADIRERAYFNRRAKALDFLRQRDREVAAFLEEQRRQAAEEARKKAEEERQREAARLPADAALGRALVPAPNPPPPVPPVPTLDPAAQRRRASEALRQRAEESWRAAQPRPASPAPVPAPRPMEDPLAAGRY